jgi:hypothetical protein
MKFDQKTLGVLKSFSAINQSLLFRKGNHLATISSSKTIMAKAKLEPEQAFPREFGVYDLSRFLGVLTVLKDPELTFEKNQIKISSGNQKIYFTYADPATIVAAPENDIKVPSEDIKFVLTDANLKSVKDAASALGSPEIGIVGDGKKIYMRAFDTKNDTCDSYSMEIGETDKNYKVVFKTENLKLLPQNYSVTISSKGLSRLQGDYVTYWIAVDSGVSDFSQL